MSSLVRKKICYKNVALHKIQRLESLEHMALTDICLHAKTDRNLAGSARTRQMSISAWLALHERS